MLNHRRMVSALLPILTTILWNESRKFMTHFIIFLNVKEESNLKISGYTFNSYLARVAVLISLLWLTG